MKNQRVPADLSDMLAQIAWFERKTVGAVIKELAGDIIRKRYESIPKQLRERILANSKLTSAK